MVYLKLRKQEGKACIENLYIYKFVVSWECENRTVTQCYNIALLFCFRILHWQVTNVCPFQLGQDDRFVYKLVNLAWCIYYCISFWIKILFSLIGNIQTLINTSWNINNVVWKSISLAKLKETDYNYSLIFIVLEMFYKCFQHYFCSDRKWNIRHENL